MKAIQIREYGEASVLQIAEVQEPRPRQGEVLIEVKAAGVNYADILMRRGSYGRRSLPFVPGFEAAGIVLQPGPGVTEWKPGQRVMGTVLRETCGCYAARAVMPSWLLMAVPDNLDFEAAAAFPEVFITAYLALHVFGRVQPGESVLIHAAGGGVGTAAVQLAHAMAARVFGTASSDEKLRRIRVLGADVGINYATTDFVDELTRATQDEGVDVALESVGGEVFEKTLRCLKPLGRLVVYGTSSGAAPTVGVPELMTGSINVAGFTFGGLSLMRPDIVRDSMNAVMKFLADAKVHPVAGHKFPLERARAAHELISSRASFGKVVLVL
ncbi:MAG: NADPH:quinone oxidoreductase family protein [Acidobacteria bacterium]|nr:NADPH:quinone oxidoreductase family protein [Acidobacteriota bacterium]